MDEGMTNYAEYRIAKKVCGSYMWKRILMIAGWCMVPLLAIVISLSIKALSWMLWVTPLFFTMSLVFGRLTFRYLQIEYEYRILTGMIKVERVYGNAIRKDWLEVRLSEMSDIAPYEGEYKAKADAPDIVKRYEAVSYLDSPDAYYGIFVDEDGSKCVLFFEATNKILKLCKLYNRATVVKQVRF